MFPSTQPEPANILLMVYAGSGAQASRGKEREGGIPLQKVGCLTTRADGKSFKMKLLKSDVSSALFMLRSGLT